MVKLTTECIERKYSQMQLNKSLRKEIKKDLLTKLTHLYMNDMFITDIGDLAACKNLKVAYLQSNSIPRIENLHFATNLTHLYLQHNMISKIENVDCLQNLKKFYLGYNNIGVVEGLENLKNLIELHVEHQRIPFSESLCFDPRTTKTLSRSLKILNISGNKLTSLKSIANMYELETLKATNNLIDDITDLTETISTLNSLKELCLQGNPVCQSYRYRENLIANNDMLVNLDEKTVTEVCRNFMKKLKMEKHFRQIRKTSKTESNENITKLLNLPPAFERSISRAIFQHSEPKLSVTITPVYEGAEPKMFPPWKSALAIRTVKSNHITSRPL